jgi:protocatechuate 3,4-dioxygenase beta subunit
MGVSIRAGSALVGVASMFFLGACDDKFDFANVITPVATTLTVVAGSNGQTGIAGQPLPVPITVHVLDQNGNSIAGAVVSWTIMGASGSVSSPTSTTNAAGDASVIWTLGTAAGTDSLTASLANGASVVITATATAGPFANLAIVSGDNQNVNSGTESNPFVVRAVDANGNPVEGVSVGFTSDNAGTLNPTSMTSDANGLASTTLTPTGSGIAFTVTATAGTSAVTFHGNVNP